MTPPRLPSVAAVEGVAIISGHAAEFLGDALAVGGPLRGELEALLSRSRVRPEDRELVRRACAALRVAGKVWRLREERFRAELPAETETAEGQACSELLDDPLLFSASEVGPLLGVTDRRVRGLAAAGQLPGDRDARGRWWFRRVDVEAELQRRGLDDVRAV